MLHCSNDRQPTMPTARSSPLLVDLALQGGGAHGAFTWGVLDRLLEEAWLTFDGISGTSAGAMNAAVMASGHAHGGVEGAKAALETFWKSVSEASKYSPVQRGPMEMLTGKWTLENSPMYMASEMMSRIFSPYDLNPMGTHPLREILAETVDFECAGRLAHPPVHHRHQRAHRHAGMCSATREITPDVLLASGCLPTMFQAVEIDGEHYWDGGYVGNPTITPLVRECRSNDTILVQINPIVRDEVPKTARDDPEPPERGRLQRAAAEGTAHDRAAPQGGRPRPRRRQAVGRHAHPPHRDRPRDRARFHLQADHRMALPVRPARRRAAHGASCS